MEPGSEPVRVDQWLWAVRIYKTRSAATAACRAGHVKVDGKSAKPATPVGPGDMVHAYAHKRHRELEVTKTVAKRVGPPVAVTCFVDHTPPEPAKDKAIPVAQRERGAGRPTKRERREIDRLRGRR